MMPSAAGLDRRRGHACRSLHPYMRMLDVTRRQIVQWWVVYQAAHLFIFHILTFLILGVK